MESDAQGRPPRRVRAVRVVGARLPFFRGRGMVLHAIAGALLLPYDRRVLITDPDAGELVVSPEFRGPMRDCYFGVVAERPTLSVAKRFLRPGDEVIDVGANFGRFARLFATLVGSTGHVHAFEPNSRLFEYLEANALVAPCRNVSAHRLALGAKTELRTLRICEPSSNPRHLSDGMSTFSERLEDTAREEVVEVRALDDLYPELTPAMMKVDVEGWEIEVLRGARRMVGRMLQTRSLIIVEAHLSHNDEFSRGLHDEVTRLCDLGMRAVLADDRSLTWWDGSRSNGNLLLFNAAVSSDLPRLLEGAKISKLFARAATSRSVPSPKVEA